MERKTGRGNKTQNCDWSTKNEALQSTSKSNLISYEISGLK